MHINHIMLTYQFKCISIAEYRDPKFEDNVDSNCGFDHPAGDNRYCRFKVDSLNNCSPTKTNQKYGFPEKRPCIFLKLNRVSNSKWFASYVLVGFMSFIFLCFAIRFIIGNQESSTKLVKQILSTMKNAKFTKKCRNH